MIRITASSLIASGVKSYAVVLSSHNHTNAPQPNEPIPITSSGKPVKAKQPSGLLRVGLVGGASRRLWADWLVPVCRLVVMIGACSTFTVVLLPGALMLKLATLRPIQSVACPL